MGIFDDDNKHKFGISHNSIHESMHHGHPDNIHKSIHDHGKIHESMHFGKDIVNPFSSFDDDES